MTHVFASYHPSVPFAFIAIASVFSMVAMHPVYVSLSLAGAFMLSLFVRGRAQTLRSLCWVIPMCAIVAIANPLFSASGSTELFRLGGMVVYMESLAYGLCSGAMFASVLLWLASYARCMTGDNTLALLGNVAPTVTLMMSQVLRLVPQFVLRGHTVSSVHDAASAAAPRSKSDSARARLRIVSVLMEWGMEDGIDRTDAMRARGYDCGAKRTMYKRLRFGRADAVAMAFVVLLALANVPLMAAACTQYSFYPTMSTLVVWWGYAVYGAFLAIPAALRAKEWLRWRSLK